VEAGYNTFTEALRIVRGHKKGTQCPGGYNYRNLALQVWGVSDKIVI
jgi:hypothetical protein